MTRLFIVMCGVALSLVSVSVSAQQLISPPGSSQFNPPPPPPPPPPKIEVPPIPKLGEVERPNYVPRTAPPSFGDRVTRCLHEGAAAGLGPNDRAAYSRSCANQQ